VSPFWILVKQDDGGGGDNWSCKTCKAPAKLSPSTNQHPVFLQAGCSSCQPTNFVKALKGKALKGKFLQYLNSLLWNKLCNSRQNLPSSFGDLLKILKYLNLSKF